ITRLPHAAALPAPGALIRRVQAGRAAGGFARGPAAGAGGGAPQGAAHAPQAVAAPAPALRRVAGGAAIAAAPEPQRAADAVAAYPDFQSVVDLIRRMKDGLLLTQVEDHVRLVRYTPGRIEFEPTPEAPRDLAQRLAERLRGWTGGARWGVSVTAQGGGPTLSERKAEARAKAEAEAMQNPVIAAIFAAAPGARFAEIR
ncbi:DNA polymerase III subunits gamma and tau, partial [Paracoccus sanguinis]